MNITKSYAPLELKTSRFISFFYFACWYVYVKEREEGGSFLFPNMFSDSLYKGRVWWQPIFRFLCWEYQKIVEQPLKPFSPFLSSFGQDEFFGVFESYYGHTCGEWAISIDRQGMELSDLSRENTEKDFWLCEERKPYTESLHLIALGFLDSDLHYVCPVNK